MVKGYVVGRLKCYTLLYLNRLLTCPAFCYISFASGLNFYFSLNLYYGRFIFVFHYIQQIYFFVFINPSAYTNYLVTRGFNFLNLLSHPFIHIYSKHVRVCPSWSNSFLCSEELRVCGFYSNYILRVNIPCYLTDFKVQLFPSKSTFLVMLNTYFSSRFQTGILALNILFYREISVTGEIFNIWYFLQF